MSIRIDLKKNETRWLDNKVTQLVHGEPGFGARFGWLKPIPCPALGTISRIPTVKNSCKSSLLLILSLPTPFLLLSNVVPFSFFPVFPFFSFRPTLFLQVRSALDFLLSAFTSSCKRQRRQFRHCMVLFDVQDTAVFSLVPLRVAWTHDLRCLHSRQQDWRRYEVEECKGWQKGSSSFSFGYLKSYL